MADLPQSDRTPSTSCCSGTSDLLSRAPRRSASLCTPTAGGIRKSPMCDADGHTRSSPTPTGKSETLARASRQAILVAYRELGRPEVSAQALGAIPAIGCGLHRGPAVVNSVQLKAMIALYAWACALPGEACARMHCRPLYFQGLTVLWSRTESLIVRPLRRTTVSDRKTGKTLSTCFT